MVNCETVPIGYTILYQMSYFMLTVSNCWDLGYAMVYHTGSFVTVGIGTFVIWESQFVATDMDGTKNRPCLLVVP